MSRIGGGLRGWWRSRCWVEGVLGNDGGVVGGCEDGVWNGCPGVCRGPVLSCLVIGDFKGESGLECIDRDRPLDGYKVVGSGCED